jgi:hypothetical protein
MELLSFPHRREIVQQLSHHYAPVYDNVDYLPPWLSDLLCRAVTGEGFSKRRLYSDDDDVIYHFQRVVLINGINVVARRPDLLDRSILLGLERIPNRERREERDLLSAFEAHRPRLFGAMLDALASAIRVFPDIEVQELERMADFTRWGAAIAEAIGAGAHTFLAAYRANISQQAHEAVENQIVGQTILLLMADADEWAGTATTLLRALEQVGVSAGLFRLSGSGKVDAPGWPGAPHILRRRLNEVRSNLLELGLRIDTSRGDKRTVTIRRTPAVEGRQIAVGSVGSVGNDGAELVGIDATDATDADPETPEAWVEVIR